MPQNVKVILSNFKPSLQNDDTVKTENDVLKSLIESRLHQSHDIQVEQQVEQQTQQQQQMQVAVSEIIEEDKLEEGINPKFFQKDNFPDYIQQVKDDLLPELNNLSWQMLSGEHYDLFDSSKGTTLEGVTQSALSVIQQYPEQFRYGLVFDNLPEHFYLIQDQTGKVILDYHKPVSGISSEMKEIDDKLRLTLKSPDTYSEKSSEYEERKAYVIYQKAHSDLDLSQFEEAHLCTDDAIIAIDAMNHLSPQEKKWWNTLINQHEGIADLPVLWAAFSEFSETVKKLNLNFPEDCLLQGVKNMPIGLDRLRYILRHSIEPANEMGQLTELNMHGAYRAIHDEKFKFTCPQMQLNIEKEKDSLVFHPPYENHFHYKIQPAQYHLLKEASDLRLIFYRDIAKNIKMAFHTTFCQEQLEAILTSESLSEERKNLLVRFIIEILTNIKIAHFTEKDFKGSWQKIEPILKDMKDDDLESIITVIGVLENQNHSFYFHSFSQIFLFLSLSKEIQKSSPDNFITISSVLNVVPYYINSYKLNDIKSLDLILCIMQTIIYQKIYDNSHLLNINQFTLIKEKSIQPHVLSIFCKIDMSNIEREYFDIQTINILCEKINALNVETVKNLYHALNQFEINENSQFIDPQHLFDYIDELAKEEQPVSYDDILKKISSDEHFSKLNVAYAASLQEQSTYERSVESLYQDIFSYKENIPNKEAKNLVSTFELEKSITDKEADLLSFIDLIEKNPIAKLFIKEKINEFKNILINNCLKKIDSHFDLKNESSTAKDDLEKLKKTIKDILTQYQEIDQLGKTTQQIESQFGMMKGVPLEERKTLLLILKDKSSEVLMQWLELTNYILYKKTKRDFPLSASEILNLLEDLPKNKEDFQQLLNAIFELESLSKENAEKLLSLFKASQQNFMPRFNALIQKGLTVNHSLFLIDNDINNIQKLEQLANQDIDLKQCVMLKAEGLDALSFIKDDSNFNTFPFILKIFESILLDPECTTDNKNYLLRNAAALFEKLSQETRDNLEKISNFYPQIPPQRLLAASNLQNYLVQYDLDPSGNRTKDPYWEDKHFSTLRVDSVIEAMETLTKEQKAALNEDFNYINQVGSIHPIHSSKATQPLCELSQSTLRQYARKCREVYHGSQTSSDNKHLAYLDYLAIAREMHYRATGKFPHSTQIIATLMMTNALLDPSIITEITPGGGKSIVSGLTATMEHFVGRGVDVCTKDPILAWRDYKKYQGYFKLLDIPCAYIEPDSSIQNYQTQGINFSTIPNLSLFRSRAKQQIQSKYRSLYKVNGERKQISLILDEFDAVSQDETASLNYASADNLPDARWIYPHIYEFLKSHSLDNIKTNPKEKLSALRKYLYEQADAVPKQINLFSNEQLCHWLASAEIARTQLKEDIDYKVEIDKETKQGRAIVLVKNVPYEGSSYSEGVQQMLQVKLKEQYPAYNFPIEREAKLLDTHSTNTRIKDYTRKGGRIFGLTGTTGDNTIQEGFEKNYQSRIVSLPSHHFKQLKTLPTNYGSKKDKDSLKSIENVLKKHKKHQPILINTNNIDDAKALFKNQKIKQFAKRHGYTIKLVTANNTKQEIDEGQAIAGQNNILTISTLYGRGTDPEPTHQEGLFSIVYGGDTEREIKQKSGRAGRNGAKGQTCVIYKWSELEAHAKKISQSLTENNKDEIANDYSASIEKSAYEQHAFSESLQTVVDRIQRQCSKQRRQITNREDYQAFMNQQEQLQDILNKEKQSVMGKYTENASTEAIVKAFEAFAKNAYENIVKSKEQALINKNYTYQKPNSINHTLSQKDPFEEQGIIPKIHKQIEETVKNKQASLTALSPKGWQYLFSRSFEKKKKDVLDCLSTLENVQSTARQINIALARIDQKIIELMSEDLKNNQSFWGRLGQYFKGDNRSLIEVLSDARSEISNLNHILPEIENSQILSESLIEDSKNRLEPISKKYEKTFSTRFNFFENKEIEAGHDPSHSSSIKPPGGNLS